MLARYGDDLLSAVSSMERHGVAHRDIKPDNIGIRSLTKQRITLANKMLTYHTPAA
jgi:serine/threonine protein kinase